MADSFPAAASSVVDAFEPAFPLGVSWGGASVTEGQQLTPTAIAELPKLSLPGARADKLYTIILSDPDAPNPTAPIYAEWIHWLVVNAPGGDAAQGEDCVKYFGSAPGQGAGLHRYCVVVYEQPGPIDPDAPRIPLRSGFPPRRSFDSRTFAATHGLRPVAVLTYRAEFDASVPELVKRLQPDTC
jgi:hypothetical protein